MWLWPSSVDFLAAWRFRGGAVRSHRRPTGGGHFYPNWRAEYFNNNVACRCAGLGTRRPLPAVQLGCWFASAGRDQRGFLLCALDADAAEHRPGISHPDHSDDGSRLYINNQLVIDNWGVQAPTTRGADYFHPGGSVQIRVEYFENLERASVNVGRCLGYGLSGVTNKQTRPIVDLENDFY